MAQNRIIEMTTTEIKRCEILKMAEEKKITQKAGSQQTRVSERHFRRLWVSPIFVRKYTVEIHPFPFCACQSSSNFAS